MLARVSSGFALLVCAAPLSAQVTCGQPTELFTQCPGTAGFTVSEVASYVRSADDFSLPGGGDVERIRWWGTYADPYGSSYCGAQPDLFGVYVWSSGPSGPSETGLVADLSAFPITRSATPVTQFNQGGNPFDIYEYELDLSSSPLKVPAGVTWWLEVHNDLTYSYGCYWNWVINPAPSNGFYSYNLHWPGQLPWSGTTFPYQTPGFDLAFCLLGEDGGAVAYCTAGISASGCTARIGSTGTASATAPSGFQLLASGVEGDKDGLFFYGKNGRQANTWGNGTSFQCVVPPVKRGGLLQAVGAVGSCDGSFVQDLNARWCPTCPKWKHNPGAGAVVQAQLWYRDPQSTSNQTTSLSDAVEFTVAP